LSNNCVDATITLFNNTINETRQEQARDFSPKRDADAHSSVKDRHIDRKQLPR
jgi:hypothetical protein